MIDLNISSHSRDVLDIVYKDGVSYVRKQFNGNIERAKKCVAKQANFTSLNAGTVKISSAAVCSFDVNGKSATLNMPFIEGLTGTDFAIRGGRLEAMQISSALSGILYHQMAQSEIQPVSTNVFLEKIRSVRKETASGQLDDLLGLVERYILLQPNQLNFPLGPCHGDLTLSNIIFNAIGGVVLIDFLDTFLDSPLQDIAKINQDFQFGWSFRNSSEALKLKGAVFCGFAYPKAAAQFSEMFGIQVNILTLMSLARIAPYITDSKTEDWLIKSLRKCLDEVM